MINRLISPYIPSSGLDEYMYKYARMIWDEWFNGGMSSRFHSRRIKFDELRKRGRGEYNDPAIRRVLLGQDDSSYANYDFTPLQILPKFRSILINGGIERLYNLELRAIDKYSIDERNRFRMEVEHRVKNKGFLDELKQLTGVDLPDITNDSLPSDVGDIDIWMDLHYKSKVEIAGEVIVKYILEMNGGSELIRDLLGDLVDIGVSGLSVRLDMENGIVIEYCDPADMVYSYPESSDYRNVYYYGKLSKMPVWKLREYGTLSDRDIDKISRLDVLNTGYTSNVYPLQRDGDIDGVLGDVLHFTFKGVEKVSYKKKTGKNGRVRLKKLDVVLNEKVQRNNHGEFEIFTIERDVWYEGYYLPALDRVLWYRKCPNMAVRVDGIDYALPPYVMYAPDIYKGIPKGMIERVVPYERQMQLALIKLQQFVAKAKPPGIYIDISGLTEVQMGDGSVLNPIDIINIYNDTGNVIGVSVTRDGDFNSGKVPIQQLPNGVTGIAEFINLYNFNLNLMRDALGIPIGADASMPHPDTLVGVQQGVNMSSFIATRHILDGALNILKRVSELCILYLSDAWRSERLKSMYEIALGRQLVDILIDLREFSLRQLSVFVDLRPGFEDIQRLNNFVQLALQSGQITIDEANDVLNEGKISIKRANLLLKYLRKRREREAAEREKEMYLAKGQADAQSAEVAANKRMEEQKMKLEADMMLEDKRLERDLKKIEAEKLAKLELMAKEFEYNLELSDAAMDNKLAEKLVLEDRKDGRVKKSGTIQSKLIEQRKRDKEPINFEDEDEGNALNMDVIDEIDVDSLFGSSGVPKFESGNDSMGGIDMRRFEPRIS